MKRFLFNIIILFSIVGCNSQSADNPNVENARQGTFKIVADESFRPIIDSQIKVFLNEYPKINIKIEYRSEAECFKALDSDSATRLIITTKGLTEEELKYYKAKFNTNLMVEKVANDGIAVILHPSAKEELLTKADLKEILLGTSKKFKYKPVFDGLKQTSALRFMLDSVLYQDSIPASVSGSDSSVGVINYVAKNPNSIGFVGVSWVGNDQDTEQLSFLKKVKIASIKCESCGLSVYKKPYQANIATKQYPLVRGLYYIVKNDYGGVATNFAKWLEQERGQLIFKTAYLVPTKLKAFVQEVNVEQ
jgi:phosphate transport system substrate-binding protein